VYVCVIHMCICKYACTSVYIYTYMCLSMSVSVLMYVCMHEWMDGRVCMPQYVWIFMCICVCVGMHVAPSVPGDGLPGLKGT